jgi:hypothetical protein
MKKMILSGILFFLLNTVCCAGNRPGAFTFTIADAYYHFSSKRHLENNSSMPNIALAYNADERWAMEVGVGVLNTNYQQGRGVHGFLYTLEGLYRFKPYQHFEPYAIAGVGIIGLRPLPNDSEHQGNINAGIGTQFFADESIALRAELRDLYTLAGGKNDWMANIGISFLLGGK